MSLVYYNEFEPYAVEWIKRLVVAGHVAPGLVDGRSIRDVRAAELDGYDQCHFFAGIAVWSYALRLAGWPDDVEVWTGSCPCQPFSAAGRKGGFTDDRHLWPAWFNLIRERRPPVVFGEQVASPDGLKWLDLVSADLEGAGYAFGASDLCAAGVGAPHIRQRLYFVAVAQRGGSGARRSGEAGGRPSVEPDRYGAVGQLADAGREGWGQVGQDVRGSAGRSRAEGLEQRPVHGGAVELGDACNARLEGRWAGVRYEQGDAGGGGDEGPSSRSGAARALADTDVADALDGDESRGGRLVQFAQNPTAGFWADADWIHCRDGKARPVEPGTFPLAHGAPARVGRLRAYGNAINAECAATFIRAAMHAITQGGLR